MIIKDIKIINYRNFKEETLQLHNSLNIFIGDNGNGKTNLLESIYLSSIGRTFRLNSENEIIKFLEERSSVFITLCKNNRNINIEIILEKNKKKKVKINGVPIDKTSEMIGILNNVIFTPDDMKIIKGSPSERRKFINIDISQIKPKYKYLLHQYSKVILNRNLILKNYAIKKENEDIIEIYNEYLVNIGSEIIFLRNEYINLIKKYAVDIYSDISGNRENLSIHYVTNIGNVENLKLEDIKTKFREKIKKNFPNELKNSLSLYGPQKDDMMLKINGKECKYFASQGQQRTAILSLKLSEIEIFKEETGDCPVLLLDDVLSELDNKRKSYLINYIDKIQTVITTTDDSDFNLLENNNNRKIFYIDNGAISNII